jgi:hypothetical protein
MDGLDAVFYLLVLGFILTIGYMYLTHFFPSIEGFESTSSKVSEVEVKIRAYLDQYLSDDLCTIYTEMRNVLVKAIQENSLPPTPDTLTKVEASLKKELTVTPLACPPFTYPTGHSEVEWINFLNSIPVNIGAVFVIMAVYAQRELAYRVNNIKSSLAGQDIIPEEKKNDAEKLRLLTKTVLSSLKTEGFDSIIGLCPIAAQAARTSSPCSMPQDLTPEEIVETMENIFKKMDEQKSTILSSMYIAPDIDVKPFIADALKNAVYIKNLVSKASDGTLIDHLMETASTASPSPTS